MMGLAGVGMTGLVCLKDRGFISRVMPMKMGIQPAKKGR